MYVQSHASNRENWYVSFCAFIAWDFKILLLPFQSDRPMIIFYIQKCNHCYEIWWWNFYVQSTWLRSQLLSDCMLFKWTMRKNVRIDVETKVKCLFAEADLLPSEKQNKIQEKCLKFYVISVSYLATEPNAFWQLFLADHPSRLNQKWGDGTLSKMTKPGVYHDWTTKKVFEM